MSGKKTIKFEKNLNTNFEKEKINPQNKKIIESLISKYNLNEKEALEAYKKIELKIKNDNSTKVKQQKSLKPKKDTTTQKQQKSLKPKKDTTTQKQQKTKPQQHKNKQEKNANNSPEQISNTKNKLKTEEKMPAQNTQRPKQDVDAIISDIIPGYNKELSIEANHLDLTFKVSTEKVDTIKEKVIRTIKRQKPKTMKIHAINDVSFKIFKGERVGIIGYNGAGKSTLLKVICGIFKPDKGEVKTYGNISPLLSLGAGFDGNFSGRRNIYLNGAVLGYDRKTMNAKEQEIIDFSELGEFIDIPIKNYSSGMKSKLGFSIATMVNPDILIIDEVLGVGDVNFSKKSRHKMRDLIDSGSTVVIVSHSLNQIRELCDKAIWIDNGKLREFGEVNEVCNHYVKDSEKATKEQIANIEFR